MIVDKNKKVSNKKLIIRISILVLATILVVFLIISNIKRIQKNTEINEIKKYTSVEQFKSIEEVAIFMNCKYIKQQPSQTKGYSSDIYLTIKYSTFTEGKSNQQYYERLFLLCSKVLNYEDFIIIDKSNEIIINVNCNKESQTITNYCINGEQNYFQKQLSKINIEEYVPTEQIQLNIQSEQLAKLLQDNWNTPNTTFGTKDSIFKNYTIFFEEGIAVRKINGKIFNVVFNKNYTSPIVNGITTSTTLEQIQEKLGTPQMQDNLGKVIGYKTKDIYIFFSENEISIYNANQSYFTTEFVSLVKKYTEDKDLLTFINNLKNVWADYDIYEYDKNYVYIQYSLKGVSIKCNYNNSTGIYLYTNFNGNVSENVTMQQILKGEAQLPENMYMENTNLMLQSEIRRIETQKSVNYDFSNIIKNTSEEFAIDISSVNTGIYAISFISKNENYPNRELKEYITSGAWLNNENFVYSISGKGIYKFNVKTNEYTQIKKGKENFKIKSLKNGILQYDETTTNL